jgi:hypothetical protein
MLVGGQRAVDHQLSFTDSVTRSKVQIVLERFQRTAEKNKDLSTFISQRILPGEFRGLLVLSRENEGDADAADGRSESRAVCMQKLEAALSKRDPVAACTYTSMCMSIKLHGDGRCSAAMEITMPCISVVFTPVKLKKIIATSLSQSLYYHETSDHCTGFMSLDQSRRLLLIAEDDAKAGQVPLVGLWVSGVESVGDGYIWSAVVRYLSCKVGYTVMLLSMRSRCCMCMLYVRITCWTKVARTLL